MFGRTQKKYKESVEILKRFIGKIKDQKLVKQIILDISKGIKDNHEKSSWVNVAVLITNILGFAAYCVVSPVLAEYQREKGIRIFSIFAIALITTIIIWELLCLAGCDRLRTWGSYFVVFGKKVRSWCEEYLNPVVKTTGFLFAIFVIVIVCLGKGIYKLFGRIKNKMNSFGDESYKKVKRGIFSLITIIFVILCVKPNVIYCTSLTEIYGMPTELGEELNREERKNSAAYWKIVDYSLANRMVLTYVEPYKQLEVMQQYSTAYSMLFFQPIAKIEIKYEKNKEKYLSLKQSSYEVARDNGFREPIKISYYSNSNKLILQLEKNKYGTFDIVRYSATDTPQLLNSTLLYTGNKEGNENVMTAHRIEVIYNEEGLPKIRRLCSNMYNSNGVNGEYYVYDQNRRVTTLYYLDINGEFVCNKQGIMMIDFQYEDNGNLHSIRYYGDEDREKKTEGYREVFCERFSYDSYGNLKERSQRDRNENLCSDENGVCIYRYSYDYDKNNALVEETFWGMDGEPALAERFQSTSVRFGIKGIVEKELSIVIDASGLSATADGEKLTGVENQKRGKPDEDALMVMAQLDKQSSQSADITEDEQMGQEKTVKNKDVAEAYLDEETDGVRNYDAIRYVIALDGTICEKRYCGSSGDLVAGEDGYARVIYDYDIDKRVISERYFNKKSEPYCANGDYAEVRYIYEENQNDNVKAIEYLDVDRQLAQNKEVGYACVEFDRKSENNNVKICERYIDENRKPVRLPQLGYAEVKKWYDERNLLCGEAYYDENGERTCRIDYGVAEICYEYEDSGNRISELYKDVNSQMVNRGDTGYAAVYWKYAGGKMIECSYKHSQNQVLKASVDRNTGIAGIKYTYENGKVMGEEYFDIEGNPSFRKDIGCAAKRYEYNDRGKKCMESYYGLEGEAVLRKDTGYAAVAYQDNEKGQCTSVRFYNVDGQLVISAEDHCAGYDCTYDSAGNRDSVKYIGLDGKILTRRDLGYAQIAFQYDSDGNVTEGRCLDEEGNPVVVKGKGYDRYTKQYDEDGNCLEICYYCAGKIPVLRQDLGCFKIEQQYYNDGKLRSRKFFDIDGETLIISTKYGCAGFEYEYDNSYDNGFGFEYEGSERGVRETITYIGIDEKPMVRKDGGYAKVETLCDLEGNIISVIFYDSNNHYTVNKEGGFAARRNVYENGKWMQSNYYGINGEAVRRNDEGYAMILNEYDEYGQKVKECYYDEKNEPIITTQYHCAAREFSYDEKGNQVHVKFLNRENQMMMRRDLGYAQVEMGYDDMGNKVSEAYYDIKGQPAVWKEGGYASCRDEYDNVKWLGAQYYDKKGRLTLRNDKGYAVIRNEYDEYGQRIAQTYYEASDTLRPIISSEYHCAGFQYQYDDRGNRVYVGYLDLDGNLMTRRDLGYAQMTMEYDTVGNKLQESYFDVWGSRAIDKERGYSCFKYEYDQTGRVKEVTYYIAKDIRDKANVVRDRIKRTVEEGKEGIAANNQEQVLVLRKDEGCAKKEYQYDEFGQETRCLYCGVNGEAIISTKYLCTGFEYGYDEKGNQTDIYYLGLEKEGGKERERIVRRDLGVSHIRREYDAYGNLKGEYYFDNDGPAIYNKQGYAYYENDFKDGKIIETRYYNAADDMVIHRDNGYAMVRYEFDEFGQCVSESYYGADKLPIISKESYCAGYRYEYDEVGNTIETCYVDTEGKLVINRNLGYACIRSKYDECGNETWVSYYDADNNSVARKDAGNTSYELLYDRGNCVERRYFDQQGNLMLRADTGYAIIRYEYDPYGQCIGESYYDTEEQPVFSREYQCAGRRFAYDEKGNKIEFSYIGIDEKPMTRMDLGYAQMQWEYNAAGKVSKESYLDADGQAVLREDGGYAYCMYHYDDEEQCEERQYYDLENKLVLRKDEGYAMIRYAYDLFGQCRGEYYLGLNGEYVANGKKHCAYITYEYDEKGNNTYIWYWNTKGEMEECKNTGIAMEWMEYDGYGNVTEKIYYEVNPENTEFMRAKVHKELGYAWVEYLYDGNVWIGTHYLDAEGGYMIPKGIGYAAYEWEYNDMWQISRELYYGEDGELMNYVENRAAIVEYTYNAWGYVTERKYYDKNRKALPD